MAAIVTFILVVQERGTTEDAHLGQLPEEQQSEPKANQV